MNDTVPPDAPWYVRWLIAEWRDCWRWLSVQLGALLVIAPELYEALPQLQAAIPADVFHHLSAGLAGLIIIGRVVKQNRPVQDVPAPIDLQGP